MFTYTDYNYQTRIRNLEVKIEIAARGANDISRAATALGEKYNIPEEEMEKFKEGIWALQSHLESK